MNNVIKLPSAITSENAMDYYKKSVHLLKESESLTKIVLDFESVSQIDSSAVVVINDIQEKAETENVELEFINLSHSIEKIFTLFSKVKTVEEHERVKSNFLEKLGESLYDKINFVKDFFILLSDFTFWGVVDLFKRKLRRKGEVIRQGLFIGANALPIVGLIAFLIGFILALQSANQLRQFGANIYVADLVAVAMVSEMGPLITAIIIAGRSGSAIAAEIATMKVTEEIDALKSMGIDPIPYLFVPKLFAISFAMPMLTIFANFIGIFGGAVIGVVYLDINFVPFYQEVISVLRYKEIMVALIKSLVFAVLIITTAVHFGSRAKGGPESVGKATTSSVVASIFLVIFADTMIGLIFYF